MKYPTIFSCLLISVFIARATNIADQPSDRRIAGNALISALTTREIVSELEERLYGRAIPIPASPKEPPPTPPNTPVDDTPASPKLPDADPKKIPVGSKKHDRDRNGITVKDHSGPTAEAMYNVERRPDQVVVGDPRRKLLLGDQPIVKLPTPPKPSQSTH